MGTAEHNGVRSNFNKASGKWYWEITIDSGTTHYVGIATSNASLASFAGGDEHAYSYHDLDGKKYTNGAGATFGNTYAVGDVIGIALDLENNKVFFAKNGVWQDSGAPADGTNPAYTITSGAYFAIWSGYDVGEVTANFGDSAFAYTAPVGFSSFGSGSMTITWDPDNAGNGLTIPAANNYLMAVVGLSVPTCTIPFTFVDGSTIATTSKSSGKWYWEVVVSIQVQESGKAASIPYSSIRVGIMTSAASLEVPCGDDAQGFAYSADGKKIHDGVSQSFGDPYDSNTTIGIALDLDNHKIWFSKNGVWVGNGDPESGTNPAFSDIPSAFFFPGGSPAGRSAISC